MHPHFFGSAVPSLLDLSKKHTLWENMRLVGDRTTQHLQLHYLVCTTTSTRTNSEHRAREITTTGLWHTALQQLIRNILRACSLKWISVICQHIASRCERQLSSSFQGHPFFWRNGTSCLRTRRHPASDMNMLSEEPTSTESFSAIPTPITTIKTHCKTIDEISNLNIILHL